MKKAGCGEITLPSVQGSEPNEGIARRALFSNNPTQTQTHPLLPHPATAMAKFGPRHFVAPAAAFTMAIIVGLYVKGTIKRAKWEAQYERQMAQDKFDAERDRAMIERAGGSS